jgi:hypothetical protein
VLTLVVRDKLVCNIRFCTDTTFFRFHTPNLDLGTSYIVEKKINVVVPSSYYLCLCYNFHYKKGSNNANRTSIVDEICKLLIYQYKQGRQREALISFSSHN